MRKSANLQGYLLKAYAQADWQSTPPPLPVAIPLLLFAQPAFRDFMDKLARPHQLRQINQLIDELGTGTRPTFRCTDAQADKQLARLLDIKSLIQSGKALSEALSIADTPEQQLPLDLD